MHATFGSRQCIVHKEGSNIAIGTLEGRLHAMKSQPVSTICSNPNVNEQAFFASLQQWHERIAQVRKRGIAQFVNQGVVRGVKIDKLDVHWVCEGCVEGKAHRSPIPNRQISDLISDLLDSIHSDICGPHEEPSL